MPAASLVYSPLEDMNVRGSYSQTVSRPEFRELSPIQFPEPFGLRTVVGNPDLVETTIQSVDLRWEWFLSNLELASMSFFYKDLDQPIETTVVSLSGSTATSFANSESATLYGLEWELRKDFSFINDEWADFMIFLNASWIESNSISVDNPGEETRTNTEGPLQGQAPFIINTTLQYSHDDWGVFRLLYRTEGTTLDAFGFNGLPDIFFEPRNQLDFVYTFDVEIFELPVDMKFSVENILNDEYLWTQSDITQQSWKSGVTFGLSASYRY
jgi:outer membrane receptor protein involved in Fe transport